MPTYDLTCQDCGERFERFLPRLIRDADRVCVYCGSSKVVTGVGGGFLSTCHLGGGRDRGCSPGAFT